MSTQTRRSSFSSSTSSSLAKRHASSSSTENVGKATAVAPHLAKKRAPLGDITNQKNVTQKGSRTLIPSSTLAPFSNKIAKVKKGPPASNSSTLPASLNAKSSAVGVCKVISISARDESVPPVAVVSVPCSIDVSPSKSDDLSISLDESMSTCDSFKSPEVEYIDNNEIIAIDSINKKTLSNLYISDHLETAENVCIRDTRTDMETDDKIVNVDDNYQDPQLCATIACDIYKHLRASEMKKRPSTDFMERIQKDINASMRAILVDWLVEVAEEYRLVPDTLYLTVNYIDRYLSGNVMNRQRLQLLDFTISCINKEDDDIARKYEEICAPQVEEFCYITDNTYFRDEVLEMESTVLNYLKFEMTAPTAKCFLRRFVRAAQGINEVPSMQLECLANYIAELSLLEYTMLCYAPSLVAASAIFLAKYILLPSKRPWNCTLQHYTLYEPVDLCHCVKDLYRLCCGSHNSTLPAIREKYSQHKLFPNNGFAVYAHLKVMRPVARRNSRTKKSKRLTRCPAHTQTR
ncbi:cyclin-A1-1 [Populus alba x Populus x berolinensis]|uniref:B-like cyclin n=1 Tax=Populus alba x Populus x berolinensis TaxID=444605 RepID=A0AAD6W437_9ROSI|nr:cyclin-A1-1 [Populus alba x Populus x berolinensis]